MKGFMSLHLLFSPFPWLSAGGYPNYSDTWASPKRISQYGSWLCQSKQAGGTRERAQVGQKSPSLCKPVLEVISHPFCHSLFIRIESLYSRGGDYTRAWRLTRRRESPGILLRLMTTEAIQFNPLGNYISALLAWHLYRKLSPFWSSSSHSTFRISWI